MTLAELEQAQAALEQARDEHTDALSQFGFDSPQERAAADKVAQAVAANAKARRQAAKEASRGFKQAMDNANSDDPQPDPFLAGLLADDERPKQHSQAPATVAVVFDMESDDAPMPLGVHRCDVEGHTVEYIDSQGGLSSAPADCVKIVQVQV